MNRGSHNFLKINLDEFGKMSQSPHMQARFQLLSQSTKGNKFSVCGEVWVACEVIQDNISVGHAIGKQVRLLEKGGGFPAGHLITVSNANLR